MSLAEIILDTIDSAELTKCDDCGDLTSFPVISHDWDEFDMCIMSAKCEECEANA